MVAAHTEQKLSDLTDAFGMFARQTGPQLDKVAQRFSDAPSEIQDLGGKSENLLLAKALLGPDGNLQTLLASDERSLKQFASSELGSPSNTPTGPGF